MLRLLILLASFSAAVPLQDFTESYSGKMSFPNDRVSDFNEIYDTMPIGVNSVAPNIPASNSETNSESIPKNDPGNQVISNQNSDNLAFNLNALGPSVPLGDSVPSPPLQPTTPLVLASNSGTDENPVTVDSTETDQDPWTVAQSPNPICRSENSKESDTKEIDACPLVRPDFYIRPPQAQGVTHKIPPEGITKEKRDDNWLVQNIGKAFVSEDSKKICNRYRDQWWRPFPFCCVGKVIHWYDPWGWATDRLNCVGLVVGRPYCEYPEITWFCCNKALGTDQSTWGWAGINCVHFV